jgi:hypothetical protein
MKAIARTFFLLCALQFLFYCRAEAQYPFGKNKIQYQPKDWKILETEHFEIFYYPDEIAIAEYIVGINEDLYAEYCDFFNIELDRKIPVILYGTHHDFKETNVIPYMISEGTGGFTEFIKGRVALPFMGSYSQLRDVYRHEIAHAFMLEKLRSVMNEHKRFTYNHPPLWFTEGLAEYLGKRGQDSEAHMFVRDAVISGELLPLKELWRIYGTYMMYKQGESVLHYISTQFGEDAIRVILENWWRSDKFDIILQRSIGRDLEELDREWRDYIKRRYYPVILSKRDILDQGEIISSDKRSFEVHPVSYLDREGDQRIVSIGFGLGTIDIVEFTKRANPAPWQREHEKWIRRTLIEGGRSTRFENIPLFRSRMDMKADTLVFAAKSGRGDAIYFYNVRRRRILKRISYEDVRIISSPTISRDGRYVAFSAIDRKGLSDLFLYDLEIDSFERLTEDHYQDVFPDFHPSGRTIVFSSDRCERGMEGNKALYTIDIDTGRIQALTGGENDDSDPRWLPDGKGLLFSSDRDGIYDIFLLENGKITRQTETIGGSFHPWPTDEGESFLTATYSGGLYRLYRIPLKRAEPRFASTSTSDLGVSWQLGMPPDSIGAEKKDYSLRMGLDFIGATFAIDPDFGSVGNGAQLFFTDMLGNHQLILLAGSATNTFDDFWRYLNVAATYVNLSHRLHYYVGGFHLASYIGSVYDLFRFERRYGGLAGISYPLSKFMRFDLTTVVKGMERDDDITNLGVSSGSSWLISNYASYTMDNIVWYIGGPITGRRLNVTFGRTFDLQGTRYESTTLNMDIRNYIHMSRRIIFAQRFVSRNAWGSDLQLFYLGGSWDLRGYGFRQFTGKHTLLINNELRFPLLDRLLMRFPFGYIDFPMFRGSLFLDAGKVSGFIYDTGWIGSVGAGVEMNLGYLPVFRLNFSRRTDFDTIESKVRIDFFLGFNF